MPNKDKPDGSLTQEERDKIAEFVRKVANNTQIVCPVCKHQDWYVAETLVAAPQVDTKGKVNFGTIYPLAPIICQVCGYTFFVNAARMGISDTKSEGGDNAE